MREVMERPTITAPLGVRGAVAWELLDADGSRVDGAGENSNLILNNGLDQLNLLSTQANWTGSAFAYMRYGAFRQYMAIGTGSTAPAATQTTLASEIARTNSGGGFDGGSGEITQGNSLTYSAGVITLVSKHIRVYTFTSAQNVTEYGFSHLSGANGALTIRELFRDGNGTPITISAVSGQQLKVVHTFTLTIPVALNGPTTVTITGLGNFDVRHGFFYSSGSLDNVVDYLLNPAASSLTGYYMTAADSMSATSPLNANSGGGTLAWQAYTTGTYGRVLRTTMDVAQANTTHYGYSYNYQSTTSGFKVVYNSPATIVKDSTKRLTFDVRFTYARAA